jgi:ubiquinone/menaquinone biosynthesis C-methylase UbiE
MTDNYYNSLANGYDELHGEEQINKLELIGKEIHTDPKLKDFIKPSYVLLDVGCGTGISTAFFKAKERFGIDPSVKLIEIAKVNNPYCEFKVEPAENISFKNKKFDIVLSLTAIQNFTDLDKGLDEIKRVGKKYHILTFLKKSPKRDLIEQLIKKKFSIIKSVEEKKDLIFFCE